MCFSKSPNATRSAPTTMMNCTSHSTRVGHRDFQRAPLAAPTRFSEIQHVTCLPAIPTKRSQQHAAAKMEELAGGVSAYTTNMHHPKVTACTCSLLLTRAADACTRTFETASTQSQPAATAKKLLAYTPHSVLWYSSCAYQAIT
jgi:hypothetical protein